MSKMKIAGQFIEYLKRNKKLWLVPLLVILAIFILAIIVSQSQAIAPFIYSLF